MRCLCIKSSSWYKIVDHTEEVGGKFEYVEGEIYECRIDRNGFWGDSYVVKNDFGEIGFVIKGTGDFGSSHYFSDYFWLIGQAEPR